MQGQWSGLPLPFKQPSNLGVPSLGFGQYSELCCQLPHLQLGHCLGAGFCGEVCEVPVDLDDGLGPRLFNLKHCWGKDASLDWRMQHEGWVHALLSSRCDNVV